MLRYGKGFLIISVFLIILGPWSPSRAIETAPPEEREPSVHQGKRGLPPPEERERIRKRIDLIRMWKLTEALSLNQETGAKLFPVLSRYDEQRRDLGKKRRDLLAALKAETGSAKPSEEKATGLLKDWESIQSEEQDVNRREREELKTILTPVQQAQYLVFQLEFAREIRKAITDVRERRGPAGAPKMMPGPQ